MQQSLLYGAYFFAFAATVLGIVAVILSALKQGSGPRGHSGATGAQGATGGQGLPIYESEPIILSGNQLLTLGSVPIPFLQTSSTYGIIVLGLIVEWVNPSPNPNFVLPTNLAVVAGPSAPVSVVCSFPGTATALQQQRTLTTVFGPSSVSAPLPGSQWYMLRTLDGSDPTGGDISTSLIFRIVYTTMVLASDLTAGSVNNQ